MFRFLVSTILCLLCAVVAQAQDLRSADDYYTYPILGIARLYSANFGEMRSNHFHSGVDIKSDGVIGKKVVAAADGYVSRIAYSPYGYGLALYVNHPNGTTTVYGHLDRFREDIAKYVEKERYRLKQHSVNLYLGATQFPVKKGEVIAISGNSGSSSGPHLHFEIRKTSDQSPMNPITMGVIQPKDNISPLFLGLYYIESETIDGVVHQKKPTKYTLAKQPDGRYQIEGDKPVWVGREGHFVVAVSDRKNDVSNTFGVYSVKAYRDGECFYKHQQNGFTFANTRYCNSISYYPLQRSTSTEYYRLRRQERLPQSLLQYTKGDGSILTKAGDVDSISIVAGDDMGNLSTLSFVIKGKDDKDCFRAKVDSTMRIVRANSSSTFVDKGIKVVIPSGVLYESVPYEMTSLADAPKPASWISGMKIYSPAYKVLDYTIPLHRAMEVSIEADIPAAERSRVVMVYESEKGGQSAIKGRYVDGVCTSSSRSAGVFFVATDCEAPIITPNFEEGANLASRGSLSFGISDKFSGVASYTATLNGKWIALDFRRSVATYKFRYLPSGAKCTIEIKARDLVGNESVVRRTFVR